MDGQPRPVQDWFREVAEQQADGRRQDATGKTKLTEVEKRAIEVGTRLVHYQAIRDREVRSVEPLLVMPRPSNARLPRLRRPRPSRRRARTGDLEGLTPARARRAPRRSTTYWNDIPLDDRDDTRARTPSSTSEFTELAPRQLGLGPAQGPARVQARGAGRGRLPGDQSRGVPGGLPGRSSRPRRPTPGQARRGEGRRPCSTPPAALGEAVNARPLPDRRDDRPRDLLQRDQPVLQGPGRLRRWPWRSWR